MNSSSDDDSLQSLTDLAETSTYIKRPNKKDDSITDILAKTIILARKISCQHSIDNEIDQRIQAIHSDVPSEVVIQTCLAEDQDSDAIHFFTKQLQPQYFSLENLTLGGAGLKQSQLEQSIISLEGTVAHDVLSSLSCSSFSELKNLNAFLHYVIKSMSVLNNETYICAFRTIIKELLIEHADRNSVSFTSQDIFVILFNYCVNVTETEILNVMPSIKVPKSNSTMGQTLPSTLNWKLNMKAVLSSFGEILEKCPFQNSVLRDVIVYLLCLRIDNVAEIDSEVQKCLEIVLCLLSKKDWPSFLSYVSCTLTSINIAKDRCRQWSYTLRLVKAIPFTVERGVQLRKYAAYMSLQKMTDADIKSLKYADKLFTIRNLIKTLRKFKNVDASLLLVGFQFVDVFINHLIMSQEDAMNLLATLKLCENEIFPKYNKQVFERLDISSAQAHLVLIYSRVHLKIPEDKFFSVTGTSIHSSLTACLHSLTYETDAMEIDSSDENSDEEQEDFHLSPDSVEDSDSVQSNRISVPSLNDDSQKLHKTYQGSALSVDQTGVQFSFPSQSYHSLPDVNAIGQETDSASETSDGEQEQCPNLTDNIDPVQTDMYSVQSVNACSQKLHKVSKLSKLPVSQSGAQSIPSHSSDLLGNTNVCEETSDMETDTASETSDVEQDYSHASTDLRDNSNPVPPDKFCHSSANDPSQKLYEASNCSTLSVGETDTQSSFASQSSNSLPNEHGGKFFLPSNITVKLENPTLANEKSISKIPQNVYLSNYSVSFSQSSCLKAIFSKTPSVVLHRFEPFVDTASESEQELRNNINEHGLHSETENGTSVEPFLPFIVPQCSVDAGNTTPADSPVPSQQLHEVKYTDNISATFNDVNPSCTILNLKSIFSDGILPNDSITKEEPMYVEMLHEIDEISEPSMEDLLSMTETLKGFLQSLPDSSTSEHSPNIHNIDVFGKNNPSSDINPTTACQDSQKNAKTNYSTSLQPDDVKETAKINDASKADDTSSGQKTVLQELDVSHINNQIDSHILIDLSSHLSINPNDLASSDIKPTTACHDSQKNVKTNCSTSLQPDDVKETAKINDASKAGDTSSGRKSFNQELDISPINQIDSRILPTTSSMDPSENKWLPTDLQTDEQVKETASSSVLKRGDQSSIQKMPKQDLLDTNNQASLQQSLHSMLTTFLNKSQFNPSSPSTVLQCKETAHTGKIPKTSHPSSENKTAAHHLNVANKNNHNDLQPTTLINPLKKAKAFSISLLKTKLTAEVNKLSKADFPSSEHQTNSQGGFSTASLTLSDQDLTALNLKDICNQSFCEKDPKQKLWNSAANVTANTLCDNGSIDMFKNCQDDSPKTVQLTENKNVADVSETGHSSFVHKTFTNHSNASCMKNQALTGLSPRPTTLKNSLNKNFTPAFQAFKTRNEKTPIAGLKARTPNLYDDEPIDIFRSTSKKNEISLDKGKKNLEHGIFSLPRDRLSSKSPFPEQRVVYKSSKGIGSLIDSSPDEACSSTVRKTTNDNTQSSNKKDGTDPLCVKKTEGSSVVPPASAFEGKVVYKSLFKANSPTNSSKILYHKERKTDTRKNLKCSNRDENKSISCLPSVETEQEKALSRNDNKQTSNHTGEIIDSIIPHSTDFGKKCFLYTLSNCRKASVIDSNKPIYSTDLISQSVNTQQQNPSSKDNSSPGLKSSPGIVYKSILKNNIMKTPANNGGKSSVIGSSNLTEYSLPSSETEHNNVLTNTIQSPNAVHGRSSLVFTTGIHSEPTFFSNIASNNTHDDNNLQILPTCESERSSNKKCYSPSLIQGQQSLINSSSGTNKENTNNIPNTKETNDSDDDLEIIEEITKSRLSHKNSLARQRNQNDITKAKMKIMKINRIANKYEGNSQNNAGNKLTGKSVIEPSVADQDPHNRLINNVSNFVEVRTSHPNSPLSQNNEATPADTTPSTRSLFNMFGDITCKRKLSKGSTHVKKARTTSPTIITLNSPGRSTPISNASFDNECFIINPDETEVVTLD